MKPSTRDAQTNRVPFWLWLLILLALVVPSHVIGIAKSSDIDEPWWVVSGSNYYYALTHRDFANTIYEYHPGVTTTWIVAAGMFTVFPEYRGFGQGYFDPRKFNFENFLKEHGHQPLELVRNSRLIQSLVLFGLAALLFYLLQLVFRRIVGLGAVVLAFNAPFFLGHSHLLNHEAMLAMFVVISLVSMFLYFWAGRKLLYLLLSGVAFGLAQLTKSPSIVVVPVIGLMLLADLFARSRNEPWRLRLVAAVKALAIWMAAAVLVYVLLWPGMWVAPGKMLYYVYGNAFSYAFQGARLEVAQELQPAGFSLNTGSGGVMLYLGRLFLRSTPITWLGLVFAILSLLSHSVKPLVKALIGYLALIAVLFLLMFGLAHGRDSAHYILTSFFSLDIVAAFGWAFVIAWVAGRWPPLAKPWLPAVVFGALILLQIASGLRYYPYYYTYTNPIADPTGAGSVVGYGEGLDRAAAYLSGKPDAVALRVYAYDGMGPFSYFFPGKVEVMKRAHFWQDGLPDVIHGMRWSDYVVVYSVGQDSLPECATFVRAMQIVKPEHVVYINSVEYARIYRSRDIPESVYDELARTKYNQPPQ